MSEIGRSVISLLKVADDPPLDFLVKLLAQDTQRSRRGDDRQRVEIIAQGPLLQLVGGILDPAVLVLLVEVGFAQRRAAETKALLGRARRHRS